jgi:transcriptional antiterminator NusG
MDDLPIDFQRGDRVTFREAPFSRFDAVVVDIEGETKTVHLAIPIFGRETPVQLLYEEAGRFLVRAEQ